MVVISPVIDFIYIAIAIVATYMASFHLLLWFEGRKVLKAKTVVKKTPTVSVIVPAYNEEENIGSIAKNLLNLNYPKDKLEIIFVDDGSTDNTCQKLKKIKNKRVRIFRKANGGKASAVNLGIQYAKHSLVAVVDADSILDKNAIINAVQHFSNPKIAAVTSHILVNRKKTFFEKWQEIEFMIIALARKVREKLNLVDATPGAMSIYKKEVLEKMGKFDERNLLEDVEIAWRLLKNGYRVKMAYDSMILTNYPDSFQKWWGQRTRWGIGGLQTLVKHFPCLFRSHPVGTFLIPLSLFGYLLQTIGVFTLLYLCLSWLFGNALYLWNVLTLGSTIRLSLYYPINQFLFYGLIVFFLGLTTVIITLKNYSVRPKVATLLTFLTFYIFLFPLVGVYSLYKYLRKERRWFTK